MTAYCAVRAYSLCLDKLSALYTIGGIQAIVALAMSANENKGRGESIHGVPDPDDAT